MTPQQIELVEQSLHLVRPRLDAVATAFYQDLFARDPALASLFSGEPAERATRFGHELDALLALIRRHPDFVVAARSLGDRHRGYGVRASHFGTAGPALLAALAGELGDRWTPEVAEAWRLAYNLTAEAMLATG